MPKKITSKEFIEKSRLIHGDRYDYSLVNYKNTYERINIVCKVHGMFSQVPKDHLSGAGCSICAKQSRIQTNLEIYGGHPQQNPDVREKTKQTNLQKYGKINPQQNPDIREKTKQTIIDRYGVDHPLQSLAVQEKMKQNNIRKYGIEWTTQVFEFKQKKIQSFLNKYGVDNPRKSEEIKTQITQTNLKRYGTEHYAQKHMVDIIQLINDFDWLLDQYITKGKTALQLASEIGVTDTTIGRYLRKVEIEIKKAHQSYVSKKWLESIIEKDRIVIEYEYQWNDSNKRQKADGYCKDTNTIYEFHGDYWHGNPIVYDSDCMNTVVNKTMGTLYNNTITRENQIKELGYNLVIMWESDFYV